MALFRLENPTMFSSLPASSSFTSFHPLLLLFLPVYTVCSETTVILFARDEYYSVKLQVDLLLTDI